MIERFDIDNQSNEVVCIECGDIFNITPAEQAIIKRTGKLNGISYSYPIDRCFYCNSKYFKSIENQKKYCRKLILTRNDRLEG